MRHGARALAQAVGAVSQRFNSDPPLLTVGTITSWDPDTQTATAHVDYNGFSYDVPPSQVMTPWHGPGSYSDANGVEQGQQCLIACLDPKGDVFLILGFLANDDQPGIGVVAGEAMKTDKRGSFLHFSGDRDGSLRHYGNGYATVFGGNGTEVGGEQLDATNDAIITKTYLDQALSDLTANVQVAIDALAAIVQSGSGVTPPMIAETTSTGSSLARAVE